MEVLLIPLAIAIVFVKILVKAFEKGADND